MQPGSARQTPAGWAYEGQTFNPTQQLQWSPEALAVMQQVLQGGAPGLPQPIIPDDPLRMRALNAGPTMPPLPRPRPSFAPPGSDQMTAPLYPQPQPGPQMMAPLGSGPPPNPLSLQNQSALLRILAKYAQ